MRISKLAHPGVRIFSSPPYGRRLYIRFLYSSFFALGIVFVCMLLPTYIDLYVLVLSVNGATKLEWSVPAFSLNFPSRGGKPFDGTRGAALLGQTVVPA